MRNGGQNTGCNDKLNGYKDAECHEHFEPSSLFYSLARPCPFDLEASFDPEVMILLDEPRPLGWPCQHDPEHDREDSQRGPNEDGDQTKHIWL